MADIFLFNTLTRKKETFTPIKPNFVGIYSCGPTVYRNVHIGNLRTYIAADLLKRVFVYNGNSVKHVKNITDVGHMRTTGADEHYDPIINEALKEGKNPLEISQHYSDLYWEDEKKLNISLADENPKATDHIAEMIEIIKKLLENKYAYEVDGTIYFDVKKFKNYGKLSGNTLDKMDKLLEAVRISVETDKKDSADFSLWKKAEEGRVMSWDSPWGKGFPGWHIECSAMATKYLGNHFDIHTGGEDLVFPHHEDEIAQSEGAFGEKFVNCWFHAGYLLIDGKKMARSAGNFYILEDLEKRGFNPLSFRYLTLIAHYRSRLNFTWESLAAAENALNNLYSEITGFSSQSEAKIGCAEYESRFQARINDDLDMPGALAVTWEMVKSSYPPGAKLRSLFKFDQVLGLNLKQIAKENSQIPREVGELIESREKARKDADFSRADEIRVQLEKSGYEVEDTSQGVVVKKIFRQ